MLDKISTNEQAADCVVLLHGYGANMYDLWSLKALFANKCVISLEAPLPLEWGGFSWFDIDFTPFGTEYDLKGLDKAIETVRDFLEGLQGKYNKIWLCGFSQGSIISHGIFLRYPHLIEGAACLSGRFVESVFTEESKKAIPAKPLFVSHGTVDQVIAYKDGGEAIKEFYRDSEAGITFKKYHMGHEIIPQCQVDIKNWFEALN